MSMQINRRFVIKMLPGAAVATALDSLDAYAADGIALTAVPSKHSHHPLDEITLNARNMNASAAASPT